MSAPWFRLDMLALVWLGLLAVLVRFFCSAAGVEFTADSMAYQISAVSLIQGFDPAFQLPHSPAYASFVAPGLLQGTPADFFVERTPGFPLLLIGLMGLLRLTQAPFESANLYQALMLTHALMGIAVVLMSADLTFRWLKSRPLALAAGGLAAVSPGLLWMEHAVMSETLYTFSLLLYAWLVARHRPFQGGRAPILYAALGCLGGWLMWVRPIGMVVVACTIWMLWRRLPRPALVAYLVPVGMMVGTWVGFQAHYHQMLGYTAGSGMNQLYKVIDFVDADSELHATFKRELLQTASHLPAHLTYAAVNSLHTRHVIDEAAKPADQRRPMWRIYREDDQKARDISLEAIFRHPLRYARVTLRETIRLFTLPTDWDGRNLFWFPLMLLALIGAVRAWRFHPRHSAGGFIVLILVAHWGLYAILTLASARYRIPLEPLILPLALLAFGRLSRQIRHPAKTAATAEPSSR